MMTWTLRWTSVVRNDSSVAAKGYGRERRCRIGLAVRSVNLDFGGRRLRAVYGVLGNWCSLGKGATAQKPGSSASIPAGIAPGVCLNLGLHCAKP
jgi:hypothetical protein